MTPDEKQVAYVLGAEWVRVQDDTEGWRYIIKMLGMLEIEVCDAVAYRQLFDAVGFEGIPDCWVSERVEEWNDQ